MHAQAMKKPARHYDNDWLTVLAMVMVFFFHCARFFNDEDWHVKNNVTSEGATVFVMLVSQWIMPMFFLLSGMSSRFSLQGRSWTAYLGNRWRRLMVPLIFASLVVQIPLQVWIERVSHGRFQGSFPEFYPHYFDGWYAFGGNFAWMGLHLWYLEMLFLFTLITLPFFARIGSAPRFGGARFKRPGAVLLLFAPLLASELLVNQWPQGLGMRAFGGWSPLSYLVVFCLGFVMAEEGFREGAKKTRHVSLLLGLGIVLLYMFAPKGTFGYAGFMLLRSLNSWAWLMAFLGYGARYLDRSNAVLDYARQAVLPFYILHQTVIVTLGFYLRFLDIPVWQKYPLLAVLALVIIMLLYEGVIRRVGFLRPLFGMAGAKGRG